MPGSGRVPDRERAARQRQVLLAQLRYLLVEAEALGPLLAGFPDGILDFAPPGERSVREAFAHLAALDREVHAPRLARLAAEEAPRFTAAEPEVLPPAPLGEVLAEVRAARAALAEAFEALPESVWERTATLPDGTEATAYDLAREIARHDAETLRTLAYRLHGAAPPR